MFPRLSRTWRLCRLALALATLAGLAVPAHAQVVGQIQGTVTDAQGAVLPGVSLTLRNTETGVMRNTVSEGDGQYRFAGLQPGTYELKAELQGFATVDVASLDGHDRITAAAGPQDAGAEPAGDRHGHRRGAGHRGDAHRGRAGDHAGADRHAADGRSAAGQPRAAAPGHEHGQHAGAPLAGQHRGRRHQQPDERVLPRRRVELVAPTPASSTPRCRSSPSASSA